MIAEKRNLMFQSSGLALHCAPQDNKGVAINKHWWKEVLICLWETINLKYPEMWTAEDWILHHLLVSCHTTCTSFHS
jgi:hypothetical protein